MKNRNTVRLFDYESLRNFGTDANESVAVTGEENPNLSPVVSVCYI